MTSTESRSTLLKRALTIAMLAVAHFSASAIGTMAKLHAAMQMFETGQPPSFVELLLDRMLTLLYFPLVTVARLAPRDAFPGLIGWLPFALNSLLWACAIVWACQWWRQRQATLAPPGLTPLPPSPPDIAA